ncbi:MAG TPA: hypothetical protein VF916_02405 [Ktedonobacterales bacterium]
MTIQILFQPSHYRTFKTFYIQHIQRRLRSEFLHLLSYTCFVELMPSVLLPLTDYLRLFA